VVAFGLLFAVNRLERRAEGREKRYA
jgi:hypothetical protein